MGLMYGLAASHATTRQHSQQRGGDARTAWEGALDEALTGEMFIDPSTTQPYFCCGCLVIRVRSGVYLCPACEDDQTERWAQVVGWEGLYEVSNQGRVRSLPRTTVDVTGRRRDWPGKIMSRSRSHHGYLTVRLSDSPRRTATWRVHQLVAHAFLGPVPPGKQVGHNNGDPSDNRVANLRYVTPRENQADRVRHGTDNRGERHPLARLTQDDVLQIRRLDAAGMSCDSIAELFPCSPHTIAKVAHGRTWRHLAREGIA